MQKERQFQAEEYTTQNRAWWLTGSRGNEEHTVLPRGRTQCTHPTASTRDLSERPQFMSRHSSLEEDSVYTVTVSNSKEEGVQGSEATDWNINHAETSNRSTISTGEASHQGPHNHNRHTDVRCDPREVRGQSNTESTTGQGHGQIKLSPSSL